MFEWPPNFALFFAVVAFLAASVAVRGWRDLLIYLVLVTLLALPLKWIGTAFGLTAFAGDMIIHVNETRQWKVGIDPTGALLAAFIVAALAMIAWKEFLARRAGPRD
jgi:hypothetical protein